MAFRSLIPFLILLTALMGLTSCEGNTDRYYILQNQSNEQVTLTFQNTYTGLNEKLEVQAGQGVELLMTSQRGGSYHVQEPTELIQGLSLFNESGDSWNTLWQDLEQWSVSVDQVRSAPVHVEHFYVIVVTEADFVD